MTAGHGGRRGGPDEKHRTYTLQPGVERFGYGKVARDHLDGRWQPCRRRPARERAHRHARGQQFVDHESPDAAGGSGHEDRMHAFPCHELISSNDARISGSIVGSNSKPTFTP